MARVVWAERQFTPQEVNRAGRGLADLVELHTDVSAWTDHQWEVFKSSKVIINNWRTCHAYPLNVLQTNLRRSARRVEQGPLIAQRTKRLVSIVVKLNARPKMKLTQMQDIGGCRAIVRSVGSLRQIDRFYKDGSDMKHVFAHRDDYVDDNPQPTGYRGIHLVYRYFSDKLTGKKFSDLKIEMQLRSLYQHAWATAVETTGTFEGYNLKAGYGPADWLRFFSLMGAAIAQREETKSVPGTPTNPSELRRELLHYARKLKVANRLHEYTETLRRVEDNREDSHYYVLKLDPIAGRLDVKGFHLDQYEQAQAEVAAAEGDVEGRVSDAVLVSVDTLAELPRAYPNYYADTRVFLELLKDALGGRTRRRASVDQLLLPL
jgi:hypothetical protein